MVTDCTRLMILLVIGIIFAVHMSGIENTSQENKTASKQKEDCAFGWIDGRSLDLGCVYIANLTVAMNYSLSVEFCEKIGSRLIEVHTNEQMDFVKNMLKPYGSKVWWGGATYSEAKKNWYWTDSGTLVADFVWAPGMPRNNGSRTIKDGYICFNGLNGYQADFKAWDCYDGPGTLVPFPLCQK